MITLRVIPDNAEPYDVTASTRDVVLWEKTHKGAKLANIEDASMTLLYELAFVASKRQKLFHGNEAEFFETVDIETRTDDSADPSK